MEAVLANKLAFAAQEERIPLRNWIAVIGSSIGAFMAVLDIQITASSLRDIQGGLGASVDEGSWISTSYLIAEIVTIPLTGWLSRVFSPRIYVVVNAVLFVIFSMLCGMSRDLNSMILCRAAQGFTGGTLIPMCFSTILELLPQKKQAIGLAIFSISATFAPSIGPAIGGYITDTFSWPYIFYLNLIPGIILILMLTACMPKSETRLDLLKKSDIPGIISMTAGLSSLIYVLEEGQRKDWFGSDSICLASAIAIVSLLFFIVRELVAKHPLVNLRLLLRRNFWLGTVANVALGLALYGSVYLLPFYLAQVQGYSAWQIGRVMVWSGLPQLAITPFVPILMKVIDSRLLITYGLTMFGASCLMNGFMTHDYAGDQLILAMLVRALGLPFIITPLAALATAGIEKSEAGSASALFSMMRNLGGSVGTAVAATVLTQREQFHSARLMERISESDLIIRQYIAGVAQNLQHQGASVWTAHREALQVLSGQLAKESFVMAFNDTFSLLALILVFGALMTLLMRRAQVQMHTVAE